MKNELIKRILSSIILIPITLFFIIKGSYFFIFFISVCFLIIAHEWYMMRKKNNFYITGLIFLIFSFYTVYQIRLEVNDGYLIFLFILLICISTDVGGYIFGKLFKGPKLTKLSPNKTYFGMIGGFILSISTIIFYKSYYLNHQIFDNFVVLTLIISIVSQIGDIIISYFKRLSNIKDTGKIIPGHGGLLDRVDGMIFAFPFSYIMVLLNFL